jgi:hypothetical protein
MRIGGATALGVALFAPTASAQSTPPGFDSDYSPLLSSYGRAQRIPAAAGMTGLAVVTIVRRMGAPAPGLGGRTAALADWLMSTPRFPLDPPSDRQSAARGRALFESANVGCTLPQRSQLHQRSDRRRRHW